MPRTDSKHAEAVDVGCLLLGFQQGSKERHASDRHAVQSFFAMQNPNAIPLAQGWLCPFNNMIPCLSLAECKSNVPSPRDRPQAVSEPSSPPS